ncbi:MAG: DUF134 domain-containing protein [Clostridia bacterium]|nr:DUF134 domain-containing protein [Clostridia bacterium]
MPRPMKCRKVCCLPRNNGFVPLQNCGGASETVLISVDEYEAIRLIDNEGFSQEQCGDYMNVARTTVQMIYKNARKKIAHALVNGLAIRIEGGDYRLCDGKEEICACGGCQRHRQNRERKGELK